MRFGFVTCVQLGLACMDEIYRAGGRLDLVVSLTDQQARTKSGRIYVDDFCTTHSIPVLKSKNVNDQVVIDAIKQYELDWLFIIGWSQIARSEVLNAPRLGVLGMHPTLLPMGRGRAAVPWAILKGLTETGVTLFQLDEGVDTGPILAQHRIPMSPSETATELYEKVQEAHRRLIGEVWDGLSNGRVHPQPQDHSKATEWPGRNPEDGRILPTMTVAEAECLVRAVTHPYPGAFFDFPEKRLRVWAGKIVSDTRSEDEVMITLADGQYVPTDYQWEPLPAPAV